MGCGSSTASASDAAEVPPSKAANEPKPPKIVDVVTTPAQPTDKASAPTKPQDPAHALAPPEAKPTPAPEPNPEPKAEPKAEPTPKPEPEPAPEPTPEPTSQPAEAPAQAEAPPPEPSAEKHVVLFIGGPGSGVSVQCAMLAQVFECAHLPVGQLMRNEVLRRTKESYHIGHLVSEGKPIPASTYTAVYKSALDALHVPQEKAGTPAAYVLADGFPRAADQLKLFEWEVAKPVAAVFLTAGEDVALERARRASPSMDASAFSKVHTLHTSRAQLMVESLERGSVPVHKVDASSDDRAVFQAICSALGWTAPDDAELDFVAPP